MAMVNHKRSRPLITWILSAALLVVFGSEAFAAVGSRAWGRRSTTSSSTSTRTAKPVLRRFTGEPDVPATGATPAPPDAQLSSWADRFQGLMDILLAQKRP